MRLREFAPLQKDPVFRLPAPPTYAAAERRLYTPDPIRAEISAFAPSLASARRLALLKRAWQQWRKHDKTKKSSP